MIDVPVPEFIQYVHSQLREYDNAPVKPQQSPYSDPIYYTTSEGKTVMVPKYIQTQAINTWNQEGPHGYEVGEGVMAVGTQRMEGMAPVGHGQQDLVQELPMQNQQYQQYPQYQQVPYPEYPPEIDTQLVPASSGSGGYNWVLYAIIIGLLVYIYTLQRN